MDYCFFSRAPRTTPESIKELKDDAAEIEGDGGSMIVLVCVDQRSGAMFSTVCTKGVNDHAVHFVLEGLKFCGRGQVVLFGDPEASIKALMDAVASTWSDGASDYSCWKSCVEWGYRKGNLRESPANQVHEKFTGKSFQLQSFSHGWSGAQVV